MSSPNANKISDQPFWDAIDQLNESQHAVVLKQRHP